MVRSVSILITAARVCAPNGTSQLDTRAKATKRFIGRIVHACTHSLRNTFQRLHSYWQALTILAKGQRFFHVDMGYSRILLVSSAAFLAGALVCAPQKAKAPEVLTLTG